MTINTSAKDQARKRAAVQAPVVKPPVTQTRSTPGVGSMYTRPRRPTIIPTVAPQPLKPPGA